MSQIGLKEDNNRIPNIQEERMHKLIKSMTVREFLLQQVPGIAFAIIIAELFYKFHSFTLECLAFLVTWYVIDFIYNMLIEFISNFKTTQEP